MEHTLPGDIAVPNSMTLQRNRPQAGPSLPAWPQPSPPDPLLAVALAQPLPAAWDKNSWAGADGGRRSCFPPHAEGRAGVLCPAPSSHRRGTRCMSRGRGFWGKSTGGTWGNKAALSCPRGRCQHQAPARLSTSLPSSHLVVGTRDEWDPSPPPRGGGVSHCSTTTVLPQSPQGFWGGFQGAGRLPWGKRGCSPITRAVAPQLGPHTSAQLSSFHHTRPNAPGQNLPNGKQQFVFEGQDSGRTIFSLK